MTHRLYLYGIFPTPGPEGLALEGLDKQPVQTRVVDGFTFLYSEARQDRYLASRRNLLGHEKVLEQAMHAGHRTLLPLQFGLIIENWETVTEQLTAPHSETLDDLFQRLTGRREVSVKLFWDAEAELQALMKDDSDLRERRDRLEGRSLSMDEIVAIGQAIERAMSDRKHRIIQAFRSALNPLAAEVAENDLLTEAMIYNAAYLIYWDEEATFSAQVEALDQQFDSRLKIRYNDFTAPYNFAQFERLN